eukprot:m51a1_g10046 putative myosin light chain (368) ;mRNA; f:33067-34872
MGASYAREYRVRDEVLATVTVFECDGVRLNSDDSEPSVYVRAFLNAEPRAARQTCAMAASAAQWHETLDAFRARPSQTLHVQVIARRGGSNARRQDAEETMMADLEFPLSGRQWVHQWFALDRSQGVGAVRLMVQLTPNARPLDKYELGNAEPWSPFCTGQNALNKETFRNVEVKSIRKASMDAKQRRALEHDLSHLKKLNHPHLVNLVELVSWGFGDLESEMASGTQFTESQACDIFCQVLEATCYLHHRGVVHQGIRPRNVLFTSPARTDVKLAPFVLSGEANCETQMSLSSESPCYTAPEVLECKRFTEACDMWALGVLFFTLLCGEAPFHASTLEGFHAVLRSGCFTMNQKGWHNVGPQPKVS